MQPQFIEFNGQKYRLHANGYYNVENWGKAPYSTLHRAIWAHHNGPIPDGWEVHHKDHDHTNNAPDNLEAMPASQHRAYHAAHSEWIGSPANLAQLESIKELAKEWHSSPEGLAWHSANGIKAWEKRKWYEVPCQEQDCSNRFVTPYPTRAKYCCSACKERSRLRKTGKVLTPRRGPYKGTEYGSKTGRQP